MNLRARITAAMVGLIVAVGLAGTFHARLTLSDELRGELVQAGMRIAAHISFHSEEALLTNDVFPLYELINIMLVNAKDVGYVFLVDANGEVRIKTFPDVLPAGLLAANAPQADGMPSVKRLPTDEGPVQDIAYPIIDRQFGMVRIGLSENRLLDRVETFTLQLLGLTGGVTLLALLFSSLLAALLTRPLARLAAAARAVGRGDLSQRVSATSGDEVGRLAAAFNAMIEDIARSHQEINEFNRELLRRSQELATLNAVAATASQSLDLQTVMDGTLDKVLPLVGADAGGILLWEEGNRSLTYRASRGLGPASGNGIVGGALGEDFAGRVAGSGKPALVSAITRDELMAREAVAQEGLCALASIPLRAKDRIVGVLNVARRDGRPFGERDVELLVAIGHQVGVSVENARLWEELKEKERARSELLEKVISAQEEERQRIARELHDELAQGLTALLMGLGHLRQSMPDIPRSSANVINFVKELASQTLADTRRLILDLRPPVLDDLGLTPAIRTLAETRLEQQGLAVSLVAGGFEERLPPHLEVAVFRVLQEAINNCARHAHARTVHIRLRADADRFHASVEDDGVGFDASLIVRSSDGQAGLGILGMRERVSLLGGRLDIQSSLGQGTTVLLDIPLAGVLVTK